MPKLMKNFFHKNPWFWIMYAYSYVYCCQQIKWLGKWMVQVNELLPTIAVRLFTLIGSKNISWTHWSWKTMKEFLRLK